MKTNRRRFIAAAGAISAVAFDPMRRVWIPDAGASSCSNLVNPPAFDGMLSIAPGDLDDANNDFGHIRTGNAVAVLLPANAEDIVRAVRFANREGIAIAMRGQAHSVFGQAQTDCGIVIDSRTLSDIHSIEADSAWVDAGVRWSTLVNTAVANGLTPPVLTDYLELSVGGVVSMGGIGGVSNRHGLVADTITELELVTGEGELVTCSARRRRRLFNAARAGLGQYGIITRVRVKLTPAEEFARVYELQYSDRQAFLSDMRCLSNDARFDFLEGQLVPAPTGGWQYLIQAACWYTPPTTPDDAALLHGLTPDVRNDAFDLPYVAWLFRVGQVETILRSIGVWDTPHPWSDQFLADQTIDDYLEFLTNTLQPADLGTGLALLYPIKRSSIGPNAAAMPETRTVWVVDLLRFPVPTGDAAADSAEVTRLLDQNRALHDVATGLGGKRYAIGAVDFTENDWREHYGRRYRYLQAVKRKFDPNRVLTPGVGVF